MGAPRIFLGLGSNLGDREAAHGRALRALDRRGFRTVRKSRLYLTEPVGGPPQSWFLNAVAEGLTDLTPEALLGECLAVEESMGRVRDGANGPRTIDLDLLLYGEEVRSVAALTLPHPRMAERAFVLVPFADIAPELRHPVLGQTVRELLDACTDRAAVRPYDPGDGVRA